MRYKCKYDFVLVIERGIQYVNKQFVKKRRDKLHDYQLRH